MFENPPAYLNKLVHTLVLPLSISVLFSFPSLAQDMGNYSHASFAEKIYLQLDSKVYTTDRTIWYKCIVANAMDHAPNTLSGVLYVELIDSNEKIIEKKTIRIENGSYSEGLYLIRAYTEWNKNFQSDFFFNEYIHVFAPSVKKKAEPISNITLVEKQNNERQLTAYLHPLSIDSLHEKELTIIITLDDTKDSLTIKKNRDEKYMVDYTIPHDCQFITLQIKTKNQFRYSKTIALNEEGIDLRFFPESGELVHGLNSKVGLKALDYSDKGKMVDGVIVNGQGEIVTSFRSNQLGMGSFTLTNVDSSTTYQARLASQSAGRLSTMYPLPSISAIGNVLSVIKKENEIRLIASSNYLKNESIYYGLPAGE